jgi:hypothetical protein
MHLTRGRVFFIAIAMCAYYAWQSLSLAAHESVVLHIPVTRNQDTYTTLWIVDDGQHLWLRSENPRRDWLERLRESPTVNLRRHGRTVSYRANVQDTADARAYVDPMFRAKYGFADELHAMLTRRDSVPIRLELP